mmetsp:Transcript_32292/g.92946  ORF Transcript_32292/g.92946 Transcript_32292/m.92946 type:complete len:261 (+) Transcript_32292:91-873(+)
MTRPVPDPWAMSVAEKHMLFRSPRGTCLGFKPSFGTIGSVFFSMGTDSPVKAASAEAKLLTASIRISAGIRSPRLSMTTSPGTTRLAGTLVSFPSRMTTASAESMALRASAACSADPSWMIPMAVLMMITPKMIPTWIQFWTGFPILAMADAAEMIATKTRIPTRTLFTWFQIFCNKVSFSCSVSLFSPNFSRRSAAWADVKPVRRMSSPSFISLMTSSFVMQCHGGTGRLSSGWASLLMVETTSWLVWIHKLSGGRDNP